MKAYYACDKNNDEGYATIVFAENANVAKQIALHTEACEEAAYTDIRVHRLPATDKLYKGRREIDWYNMNDRIVLVRDFSWACIYTSYECENCPAKRWCRHWEE